MDINTEQLENKLKAINIPGKHIRTVTSPFYTDICIKFEDRVTVNRIKARKTDMEYFFGSSVTIGLYNNCVAYRIENERKPVNYASFINGLLLDRNGLPLAVGQTDNGSQLIYDFAKCPHLLVAGATGSGKSVFLKSAITSLMLSKKCEFVLIDIKRVELNIFNGLPCLCCPAINEVETAKRVLQKVCEIMDDRYKTMSARGICNFNEYRQIEPHEQYLIVVIDELADIMIQNKKAVEKYIIRIAQLGRAAGIHLIVATQRPSTDVITGLIKSNIPSRLCFNVSSNMDSRIILDKSGGERLHGNGDGLFKPIDKNDPIRIQAPFIGSNEINKIIKALYK